MKRHIIILASFLLFLLFVSCNASSDMPSEQPTNSEAVTEDLTSQMINITTSMQAETTKKEKKQIADLLDSTKMKELITKEVTIEELNDEYDLPNVIANDMLGTRIIEIDISSNAMFHFREESRGTNIFKLAYIRAPAAIIFPKYIDMQIEQIPLSSEEGMNKTIYYLYDGYFTYYSASIDWGILRADSQISIEKINEYYLEKWNERHR